MKNYMKILLLFFAILLISNKAEARPITGAEIKYEKIAPDTFLVTARVYRDCNWVPLLEIHIRVKSALCPGTQTFRTKKSHSTDVTPVCARAGSRCQSRVSSFQYGQEYRDCVFIFSSATMRKSGCCEVNLSIQSCCRSRFTTTGAAHSVLYTEASLNICLKGNNSSPKFVNDPDMIACSGREYVRNLGASDWDRDSVTNRLSDSLVYSFSELKTNDTSYVYWKSGYSHDKPVYFRSFPKAEKPFPRGIHLDSATGMLMFSPSIAQVTVISIKVEEYRNGKKIGEIAREYQLTIIKCPYNKPPIIYGINGVQNDFEINICESKETCFYVIAWDPSWRDTVSYSYTTNIPGVPDQKLTKMSPGRIIPFCIKPDSTTAPGLYYINLNLEDEVCPLPEKTQQRLLVHIGDNGLGKFSLKKEGNFCDSFSFSAQNSQHPILDSVHWYVDGLKIGSSLGVFGYRFKQAGRYFIEGIVQNCLKSQISDSLIFTKSLKTIADKNSVKFVGLRDTNLCKGKLFSIPLNIKSQHPLSSIEWKRQKGDFYRTFITIDTNQLTVKYNNYTLVPIQISLRLIVTNNRGCTDEKVISLTLNPSRDLDHFQDIKYCEDKDSAFLLPSIHSVSHWTGDHVVNDTFYYQKNNTQDSTYLHYKGMSGPFCFLDSITFQTPKRAFPTWQSDTLICKGSDDIILSGLGQGQWKGNIKVDPNNPNQATFSPQENGVYDLTYQKTAAQEENCELSGHIQITVEDKVNYVSTPDTTICHKSQNLILKSSLKGKWHGVSIENDNEFSPTIKGLNSLVFVTEDPQVCNKKESITINVVENSNKIIIADTFSVCMNNATEQTLIGNTKNGSWIGKDKTSLTPIINFHSSDYAPGRYDFIYTDIDDIYNCSISDTTVVEINQLPKIDISLAQNKVELGKNLKINNLGNQNYSYQWNIQGSSEGKTNDFEPNVKMDELGWFNVRVIVTNPRTTCSDTLALKSVVEVIDPSSIGESHYSHLIDLYPNPSSDQITIENHGNQAIHFQLYDLSGKTVKSLLIASGNTTIDLSELAKGFYQAQFSLGNSRWMEKVVKK